MGYQENLDFTSRKTESSSLGGGIEENFDISFVAKLATKEKQIQQSYRPIVGVHKWFARRPGTVFRSLLLAEFNGKNGLVEDYWRAHQFEGAILDPFMGGGTPLYEASRLGFRVIGTDINPMAYWVVKQSMQPLDLQAFEAEAQRVIFEVSKELSTLYETECTSCGSSATAKYFLWVKKFSCPNCKKDTRLFPGYLLSEDVRHTTNVILCSQCGELNDVEDRKNVREKCTSCGTGLRVEGNARRGKCTCEHCQHNFTYPPSEEKRAPEHELWAIEYHCEHCKTSKKGRFFKRPDQADLERYNAARTRLEQIRESLPIPSDEIPDGDETKRLHRWGYSSFDELFNARQLLSLGVLLKAISGVRDVRIRQALATVFSDFLRYQNLLCRYDTYALKCQDIFSVHGFPVGLIPCENNVIGITGVGSGGFSHFIQKFLRAKRYGKEPFEIRFEGKRKKILPIVGEKIEQELVNCFPAPGTQGAFISCGSIESADIPPSSLDGVFTDPPYYDNVQYAELMDFCFAWLRQVLAKEEAPFRNTTTRNLQELTGNKTMKRGLVEFADGLSRVFSKCSSGLKPKAPLVFTYHHNKPEAYSPLVVAILDSGLNCTATIPAPAEMSASLHIAKSGSSVLDSVFVCRNVEPNNLHKSIASEIERECLQLTDAGLKIREGDIRCLWAGHVARRAINALHKNWAPEEEISRKVAIAFSKIEEIATHEPVDEFLINILNKV